MRLLILSGKAIEVSTEALIEELVDNILSMGREGSKGDATEHEAIIPQDSIGDAIREVFDRWAED